MSSARPRQRRAIGGVLALAIGTSWAAGSARAAPADDWSLEQRRDNPKLVSQRMAKLQRNPFDAAQWRALTRALGQRALADRIRTARKSRPQDVALRILEARMLAAQDDPAAAAAALAPLERMSTRWTGRIVEQRVQWLESAGDGQAAVRSLRSRAQSTKGSAREALLVRAHDIADRGDLHDLALELAQAIARDDPSDGGDQLRLARAATRAGDGQQADEAYARATDLSPARRRDEIVAERARARIDTDNPSGASELLWTLLEPPQRGSRAVRAAWWDHLSDAHRRAGTIDLLVARLGAWLGHHSDEAAAWRTLAQARQTAGFDPTDAWREALGRSPRDLESHGALVEALEARGLTTQAVEEYGRLMTRHPHEVQMGLDLASRMIAAGDREGGLSLARDIEGRVARKTKSLLLLLDFYNLNDEGEHALSVARAVVSLKPRSVDARVALGEQLFQMNHVDEALEQWAMLPKLVRPAHRGWAKHAEVLSEHGRTSGAVNSVKLALKLEPEEPQYLRLRAMLAEEQRRPGLALNLWQQVRALTGDGQHGHDALLRDEARTRVVELLVGGSIPKRRSTLAATERTAEARLDAAEPLDEAVEAGRLLAELYTRQENYAAAVGVQQRLFELEPDDPERLAQLAAAQRRAGQVRSAMGTLEDLLAAEPTRSADTLAEMSELAFEAGDAERALEAASQAVRRDRTRVDALIRLGELHERRGDIEQARRAYREAIEADPRDARARLHLAELSLTLGDTERSAVTFREILDLGGPPELLRTAGRRALDLAEASDTTGELFSLAVRRTVDRPEADEPRQFLLEALDRADAATVERWLRGEHSDAPRVDERVEHLRHPLVVALSRGSIGTRLRAAEHLGRLSLPDTALPLAELGATLRAPRDSTATVRNAFDRTRMTAIEAAGQLRDPAALPKFQQVLEDPSQSQGTRHAAAWALAGIGGPEAGAVLSRYVESGFDPMLASLGCLVLSRLPRTEISDEAAYAISASARDNANPTVRHACAFAEAALTPDKRVDRLHAQLRATDPMIAAVAAWRLGQSSTPRGSDVQALLGRYLGPAGLQRNAAAAGLVSLLDGRATRSSAALPEPAPDRIGSTVIERWLKAVVAPPVRPLPADALTPWSVQVGAALSTARAGTRAEREAAADARCGSSKDGNPVCLSPLVEGRVRLGPRN